MGNKPPHPRAVQQDSIYTFQLTLEGVMTLAADYDLMIQDKGPENLPVLWLDDKGRKFRKR